MNTIKDILEYTWQGVVVEYKKGYLVSERHVQAEWYRHLMNCWEFQCEKYRAIVEPHLFGKSSPLETAKALKGTPDMLITEGDAIIAIIEIKYVPHHYPMFEHDQNKLVDMLPGDDGYEQKETEYRLKVNPQDGEWDEKEWYKVVESAIAVHAIIAQHDSKVFHQKPKSRIILLEHRVPEKP